MEWKLEVVTIPVSDLDRASNFYAEKLGFKVDIDQAVGGFGPQGLDRTAATTSHAGCCQVTDENFAEKPTDRIAVQYQIRVFHLIPQLARTAPSLSSLVHARAEPTRGMRPRRGKLGRTGSRSA